MTKTKRKGGVSLAKGPVALVALVLLAYGITALLMGGHSFALHPPGGTVNGKTWLGLEVNAWSSLLFVAAGSSGAAPASCCSPSRCCRASAAGPPRRRRGASAGPSTRNDPMTRVPRPAPAYRRDRAST